MGRARAREHKARARAAANYHLNIIIVYIFRPAYRHVSLSSPLSCARASVFQFSINNARAFCCSARLRNSFRTHKFAFRGWSNYLWSWRAFMSSTRAPPSTSSSSFAGPALPLSRFLTIFSALVTLWFFPFVMPARPTCSFEFASFEDEDSFGEI